MKKKYPFKFLDSYTAKDKDIFFGRETEIKQLYEMVFQTDLILIYGASGTGKSSLIQCGLANKFQPHDWLPLPIRRGANMNASLEKAIEDAGGKLQAEEDDMDWFEEEEKESDLASPLAKKFKAVYLKHFRPIYLIFDQFEELYILGKKPEETQFIQTIQEILRIDQPIKIIFSIREEYLGYLYEFEKAVPELLRKKIRIEQMDSDKVKDVIQGIHKLPNSLIRLEQGKEGSIAEGIFEKIKGEGKSRTIQLPYLQVFLDKYYLSITTDQNRETEATFTLNALEKMGNIGDVLGDFLNEQVLLMAQTLSQKPDTIWEILSPFVTLEGTKEPLGADELRQKLPQILPALIAQTLRELVNRRILRIQEDTQIYEVAHDTLAKQIALKRSDEQIAILEVQRLVKTQTLAKEEAREYFTEKQLNFIEPYLAKFSPTPQESAWIEASKQHIQMLYEEHTKQLKEEKRLRKKAEKLANAFYFYANRYALTYGEINLYEGFTEKENLFYFINKNGDIMYHLGFWHKAEQFDDRGFSKVVKRIRHIETKYLIDTFGNQYLLAESLDKLNEKITALDLSDKQLYDIPDEIFNNKQLAI